MDSAYKLALLVIVIARFPHYYIQYFHKLPAHDHREPYYLLKNLWKTEEIDNLRLLLRRVGRFHTAAQDITSINEDLEISVPLNDDGTCSHAYLVPKDDKSCILPGRVDIFKHYALTGGRYGAKVQYRGSKSVVFNSSQKMALKTFHSIIVHRTC